MPYNLRKRKAQPEIVVAKKPKSEPLKTKKPKAKSPVKKDDSITEEPKQTEPLVTEDLTAEPIVEKKPKLGRPATKKVKPEPPIVKESTPEVSNDEEPEKSEPIVKKESKARRPTAKKAKPEPPVAEESEPKQPITKKPKATPKDVTKSQLVFGEDTCGELGLGKIGIARKTPTPVPIDKPITQVACGPMHTLSLTVDGEVYSYGCNDEGALGRVTDGNETLEATPTLVPIKNKVIKITAGDSHSAALTDQQEIFIWGNFRDEHGPVGLTPECDRASSYTPIQLLPKVKFTDLASGSNHMLLLDVDGDVYSFGVGAQGQLGRLKPVDVGDTGNPIAITAENRELYLNPQKVNLKNVDPQRPFVCDAVYAGNFSSFATNTDKNKNRLAAWGLNNYFQLGYKGLKGQLVQHAPKRSTFTCSTVIKNVACGPHHTLFLTKTGRVYAAGRHDYGMLGLGQIGKEICPAKCIESLTNQIVTISAGINTSFAVSIEGKLFAWGMSGINLGVQDEEDLIRPTLIKSLEDKKVVSVSTGGTFTSVIVE